MTDSAGTKQWRSHLIATMIVAFALLLGASACADEGPQLTRESALSRLKDGSADERRAAAARLGDIGLAEDVEPLVASLRDDDAETRVIAEQSLWQVWGRSGDPAVDQLYFKGVKEMTDTRYSDAILTFTEIIELKPDFAEAWNKRATAYFMAGQLQKSLKDCDEVMKRNPYHFGALAGYGQIYNQLNQPELALQYFQKALNVNPNMSGVDQMARRLEKRLDERSGNSI